MTPLPAPAPGTASAPLREGVVVFEPRGAEIHVLNGPAAVVWAACCDGIGRDELLDELAEATARARTELAHDVDSCVRSFLEHLLVVEDPSTAAARPGATEWTSTEPEDAGAHRVRLRVLDEVVELCATTAAPVDDARARCADLVTDAPPTLWMAVHDEADGRVRVAGPRTGSRYHRDRAAFRAALVSELNVATVRWRGGLALHAGGVRHPSGTIVGLLGASGAGKSTLVGALVQRGWDYLTDEALAVRPNTSIVAYPKPLALDAASRHLLGVAGADDDVPAGVLRPGARSLRGDVGPPGLLVLLDRHTDPAGTHAVEAIAAADVVTSLSPFALNLPASGGAGLAALAALAGTGGPLRCARLVYADLGRAVAVLGDAAAAA